MNFQSHRFNRYYEDITLSLLFNNTLQSSSWHTSGYFTALHDDSKNNLFKHITCVRKGNPSPPMLFQPSLLVHAAAGTLAAMVVEGTMMVGMLAMVARALVLEAHMREDA